tara:strand:- start:41909 stop:42553 length:645 start_codon:yes stop_codon:yes gene_type:complete
VDSPKRKPGRPALTPEQREERRLAKNERQRARRAEVQREKDDAKRKLAVARADADPSLAPVDGVLETIPVIQGGTVIPFEATPEQQTQVETLAGLGMRVDEIAVMVINPTTLAPISETTLRRHFERELTLGPAKANAKVAGSLFKMATGTSGVKRDKTAAIFWAKARMGWRETQHVEVDLKAGVLIAPAHLTPEEWVEASQVHDAGTLEPGAKT